MHSRSDLRRSLRAARLALSGRRRLRAEALIARRISRLPAYRRARTVAAYLPFDGEVDLSGLVRLAAASGKALCLPQIGRGRHSRMRFRIFRAGGRLRRNRFGILEPAAPPARRAAKRRIDLVLVPTVGFDSTGTRLGMGGGFYDRYFGTRARSVTVLVGVAFECQKLDLIDRQPWDVPMDMIVTEKAVYRGTGKLQGEAVRIEDRR